MEPEKLPGQDKERNLNTNPRPRIDPRQFFPELKQNTPYTGTQGTPIIPSQTKPPSAERELEHFASPAGPKKIETDTTEPVIRTLKADSEALIKTGQATVVSSAAAAARRRAEQGTFLQEEARGKRRFFSIMAAALIVCFLAGGGALIYFSMNTATPNTKPIHERPLDITRTLSIDIANSNELSLRAIFLKQVQDLEGKLGSIVAVNLVDSNTPGNIPLTTSQFFSALNLRAENAFIRTLKPDFTLGIHIFDGNQPFLIFKTDYYEQTFAGMLAWEKYLAADIGTLLRNQKDFVTASSTDTAFLSQFSDEVIENHDTRVLRNEKGDILLLYTFPDQQTLLITTSSISMLELINRLNAHNTVPTN